METETKNNPTLDRIEAFLRELIEALVPQPSKTGQPGRPAVLPALCLWAGVVVCVLRGWSSQLGIWRLLASKGLWDYPRFPLTDQAVYNRLERAGDEPLKQWFELGSAVLEERVVPFGQSLARFATEVVAIDVTTLDRVLRHLPLLREVADGDARLLPGKLAGVFDVRLQQLRYVEHVADPQ